MKSKKAPTPHQPIAVSKCHMFVMTKPDNDRVVLGSITATFSESMTQPAAYDLLVDSVQTWLHHTPQGHAARLAVQVAFMLHHLFDYQDEPIFKAIYEENGILSVKVTRNPQKEN